MTLRQYPGKEILANDKSIAPGRLGPICLFKQRIEIPLFIKQHTQILSSITIFDTILVFLHFEGNKIVA